MQDITRILVGIDFEEPAERALELAEHLARKLAAKLTLVHVRPLMPYGYMEAVLWPVDDITERTNSLLHAVVARVRAKGIEVDSETSTGVAWVEIIALAERRKADLVVLGTHGRRGLAAIALGSVAENVVRHCKIPVLTVRNPRKTDADSPPR